MHKIKGKFRPCLLFLELPKNETKNKGNKEIHFLVQSSGKMEN
jgi:hypothetical protein